MRTLDEQNTRSFAPPARLVRNVRLLLRLATMIFEYFTTGTRIRRRYRELERRGETYWLDDPDP